MRRTFSAIIASALLAGCNSPGGPYPSLGPRAAEALDPRLPVAPLSAPAPATAALSGQIEGLVRQARSGDAAFRLAIAQAERLAGATGAARGEGWILAQQALSAAIAARAPTMRALGDVDELAARQLEQSGTISPADLSAVQAASATIGAIARDQQARIDAVSRRLGA